MSKRQNQSISGTISNLIDEGFDLVSSLKEITDNSIGALGSKIRLFLDPINLTLYVIDNGHGMNKSGLTKLATLNDRKEISEAKQGKYGQGVKLALAYLTQLKGAIIIISKSQNYDASKEDAINQIIIDFPNGIETDNYNPTGETACTANKNLWEEYASKIDTPITGTLIILKMDKRICKELYKKIITDSPQENIIADVGRINYKFLSNSQNTITISTLHVLKNNEPEITLQNEFDDDDNDDNNNDSDNNTDGTTINQNHIELSIQEISETVWDAECSEEYIDYDVPSICPLGNLDSDKIRRYECYILENSVKDINTVVKMNDNWFQVTAESVANLSVKPQNLGSDINEVARVMKSRLKSKFNINLAHSDNWIEEHTDVLCQIIDCDPSELPQQKKDSSYGKILSFLKGNYYSRNGTISLNARPKAKHTTGGDRSRNIFEDNIIALIEYPSKADKEFGVTVKKYSTIEDIVHASIRNIIYFLKKRWATDYNNDLKKKDKERLAKIVEEKRKAELEAEAKRKSELEAEAKRKAELELKRLTELEAKRLAEFDAKRLADEAEAEKKRISEIAEAEQKRLAGLKKVPEQNPEPEKEKEPEKEPEQEPKPEKEPEQEPKPEKEPEQEPEQPQKPKAQETPRSSNIATYLNKKDMLSALDKWGRSTLYKEELEEVVNYMCGEYQLYTKSILTDVLKILTLNQKIHHLRIEITKKYKNDSERVSCGTDFIKAYQKYF